MKNNDDSKMIHFSFVMNLHDNIELVQKIRQFKNAGYNSQSDLLRDAVIRFFDDTNNANNIKEKLEQAKLIEKLNKNADHSLVRRKLDAETRIAERHADNLDTIGANPSKQAKKAMGHYVHKKLNGFNEEVQRKYKLNYFENDPLPHKALCSICEVLFEGTDRQEVTDDICWHIEEIHKQRAEIVVSKN